MVHGRSERHAAGLIILRNALLPSLSSSKRNDLHIVGFIPCGGVVYIYMNHTKSGYEIRVESVNTARYGNSG